MALSVLKRPGGPTWPVGFVNVSSNGTPVCIMNNVDANNNWSPSASPSPGNPGPEYSIQCAGVAFQAYKPGNNNNGMVQNANNVYVLVPGNGSANRSDSGAMMKVLFPGADYTLYASDFGLTLFNPYELFLDSDVNGDGALCMLIGPRGL